MASPPSLHRGIVVLFWPLLVVVVGFVRFVVSTVSYQAALSPPLVPPFLLPWLRVLLAGVVNGFILMALALCAAVSPPMGLAVAGID